MNKKGGKKLPPKRKLIVIYPYLQPPPKAL